MSGTIKGVGHRARPRARWGIALHEAGHAAAFAVLTHVPPHRARATRGRGSVNFFAEEAPKPSPKPAASEASRLMRLVCTILELTASYAGAAAAREAYARFPRLRRYRRLEDDALSDGDAAAAAAAAEKAAALGACPHRTTAGAADLARFIARRHLPSVMLTADALRRHGRLDRETMRPLLAPALDDPVPFCALVFLAHRIADAPPLDLTGGVAEVPFLEGLFG